MAADLLLPVWGAATNAEDALHLPCLHKPPVQVQSSTKSVNWYPLSGPHLFGFREKYWQPDLVGTRENEQLLREAELTLIFCISQDQSKFPKLAWGSSTHLYADLNSGHLQKDNSIQRVRTQAVVLWGPYKDKAGWAGHPPGKPACRDHSGQCKTSKQTGVIKNLSPSRKDFFTIMTLYDMVNIYITMEDIVFTWLLLAHQK